MKVIITGTSGMIGKGVLLESLDHVEVEKVLSIGRSKLDLEHPKLEQVVHKDFSEFLTIREQLEDYDAVYHCMGVSAAGLSEENYTLMTYDYSLALARVFHELNPSGTFIYVSGEGTDSSEKGRMMWARVKGKTENALLSLGFRQAFMFRPGAIIPLRGIKSRTRSYQFIYDYFMWLLKIIKKITPRSIVKHHSDRFGDDQFDTERVREEGFQAFGYIGSGRLI